MNKRPIIIAFLMIIGIEMSIGQIINALYCDNRGRIITMNNIHKNIYTGFIDVKIERNSLKNKIFKYNVAKINTLRFFLTHGDVFNGRLLYGNTYMDSIWLKHPSIIVRGFVNEGFPEGEWKYFDNEQNLLAIFNFSKGKAQGIYTLYFPLTGKVLRTGFYNNNVKDGEVITYDSKGLIIRKSILKDGKMIGDTIINHKTFQIK